MWWHSTIHSKMQPSLPQQTSPMEKTWVFCAGEWREGMELSVTDRGMRYGMAFFETIAICAGQPLMVDEHLEIFFDTLRKWKWLRPEWPIAARNFLRKKNFPGDGMVRLYATAGPGAPLAPVEAPQLFAVWSPCDFPTVQQVDDGVAVSLGAAPLASLWLGLKSACYWPRIEALRAARQKGCDEALLLDTAGRLVSACMANVFVKLGDEWITPSCTTGARAGAVRRWMLAQPHTREGKLYRKDLARVEEICITNSRLGVMPVRCVEGRPLPSMKSGQSLAAAWRKQFLERET